MFIHQIVFKILGKITETKNIGHIDLLDKLFFLYLSIALTVSFLLPFLHVYCFYMVCLIRKLAICLNILIVIGLRTKSFPGIQIYKSRQTSF